MEAKIIKGELVKLPYVNQKGTVYQDKLEFYIRCSVQDYFIKLCESNINLSDLEKLYQEEKLIHPIQIKGKIVKGNFDKCDHAEAQSRFGYYVQILEIIPN